MGRRANSLVNRSEVDRLAFALHAHAAEQSNTRAILMLMRRCRVSRCQHAQSEARALFRELGDQRMEARAILTLARTATNVGQLASRTTNATASMVSAWAQRGAEVSRFPGRHRRPSLLDVYWCYWHLARPPSRNSSFMQSGFSLRHVHMLAWTRHVSLSGSPAFLFGPLMYE